MREEAGGAPPSLLVGGTGEKMAALPLPLPGEEPVAVAALARSRLDGALSVRGAAGPSLVSRASGPPCVRPRGGGRPGGAVWAGRPWAAPCGPGGPRASDL